MLKKKSVLQKKREDNCGKDMRFFFLILHIFQKGNLVGDGLF